MNTIPKTIHYCWFGGKPYPVLTRRCIESWKRFCPEYEIKRWDEDNFDISQNHFCKKAHEKGMWAFVSDYARLKVIYDNGGFYLDTDVELIKPLDSLLHNIAYFGIQQVDGLCASGLGFGAVKNSQIVKEMLQMYDDLEFDVEKLRDLACPRLNNQVLCRHGYDPSDEVVELPDVTVYPPSYFDPIAPGKKSRYLVTDNTVSIHHYSNSWGSKGERIRRQIIDMVGFDRIARFKEKFSE